MTLICVSLIDVTIDELFDSAEKCKSNGADIIELRVDYLNETLSYATIKELSSIKKRTGLPVIFTLRPTWEGGKFDKNDTRRTEIFEEVINFKFDYIDIEFKMDEIARQNQCANDGENSHHDNGQNKRRSPGTRQDPSGRTL